MTRHVWLECSACPSASEPLPRSDAEKIFRKLWASRAALVALAATEAWDLTTLRGHDASDSFDAATWIREHADHHVFLHDDYGGVAPIDGEGRCERSPVGFGGGR